MEIVGPAGNFDKMKASIKAGASEVFFGLKGFGARRNNDNFNVNDILEGIDYAHLRNVKTLLTLNTIMKDVELINAYKNFVPLYEHGIDAVIVQDLGFVSFLKKQFPKLILHGSTQMTVANHVEANFLKSLGFTRVVLARELSFEEIRDIRKKTDIELEVFVSGSLCISYSGNCYISSFIGGRSGNRGMCAYTCRKKFKDSNNNRSYILSPNDQLYKKEEIEKLLEIGITAIKVEGRKKQEQYAYETVSYYRDLLNGIDRESMTYKLFNRGYSKGYFYLDDKLMNPYYSSNFGYLLGKINNKEVKLLDSLTLGDGVQYSDEEFNVLQGEYVNKIITKNGRVKSANKGDVIIVNAPKNAKYLYKNYSKELNDEINEKIKQVEKKIPIYFEINAQVDEKLKIKAYTYNLFGKKIEVTKYGSLLEKRNKQISNEDIISKIDTLGDTNYYLEKCDLYYDDLAFVAFSEIKNIKREIILKLNQLLLESYKRDYVEKTEKIDLKINENKEIFFSALVSNKEQEKACKDFGITKIYYDVPDIAKQKNLEKDVVNNNDNLIMNLYHLDKGIKEGKKGQSINWNLNVFNNYAIKVYESFPNIDTIFISPELNYRQIKRLHSTKNLGMVIYGRLKGMYIEHPVIKEDYLEIEGEFYDRYKIQKNSLENTILYMHMPMNLIPKLDLVESLGVNELRLDFTFENYEQTMKVLKSLKEKNGKYTPYAFEDGVA